MQPGMKRPDAFDPSTIDGKTRAALEGRAMILGVGAQKAGTSWLFDYLAGDPAIFAPPVKELHFFNAWLRPGMCGGYDERFTALLKRVERSPNRLLQRHRLAALRARVEMIGDRSAYLRYFAAKTGDRRVMTEVSPCYSLLHQQDFRTVRDYFGAAGVTVRPILILRDPVDRHYSALRMASRDTGGAIDPKARFDATLRMRPTYFRGRYDRVIKSLWRAFGKDGVAILFYENLFADPESHLRRIADFTGITYRPADSSRRVNASPVGAELDVTQVRAAIERFQPTYDFINTHFQKEKPESWRA